MTPDALRRPARRTQRWIRRWIHRRPAPDDEPRVTATDTGQDPDQVRAYWDAERADAARPREQRRDP
jgi:hypothetical protein